MYLYKDKSFLRLMSCHVKLVLVLITRKSLKQAKKTHDNHEQEIRQLEQELEEVERKRQEFEERIEEESQSQGRDLDLEESQVRYLSLRGEIWI